MNELLVWPMLAQVALTAAVWVRLYVLRIAEMRRRRIDPQKVSLIGAKRELLEDTRGSDNFGNLFEVPVLFYAACLAAGMAGLESSLFVALAWLFVMLRAIHSLIHTTYNRVMHRFSVHVASTVTAFLMWLVLAAELVA
ncbi:MAG: MAPEG family protein [Woeseiaceae bacterium]|nr:MAPEG family protein [Woeseiaceae bacterium]